MIKMRLSAMVRSRLSKTGVIGSKSMSECLCKLALPTMLRYRFTYVFQGA
jgi:hypothetical protein